MSPPTAAPRRAAAWLLPDLAGAVAIITLLYCLVIYGGTRRLFRDSDTGWHIRNGETILNTGVLPRADPYSFSKAGEPWFAWEWGADAAMGLAHRQAGLPGVAMLYAFALAGCSWLWVKLCFSHGANFFLTAVGAWLMLSTANLHWLARPHVLSWLCLLALLLYLRTPRERFTLSQAAAIAGLTILWTNLHASFFLAPCLLALNAAVRSAELWLLHQPKPGTPAGWYARAALVSAAATLANPYGWLVHGHIAAYLTNGELLSRIAEFQSFNFRAEGANPVLACLVVTIAGGLLALAQRNLPGAVWVLALAALALKSARGLPVMALAGLPVALASITETLGNPVALRPALAGAVRNFVAYSGRLVKLDRAVHGAALLALAALFTVLCFRIPAVRAGTGFPPGEFAVEAMPAVEKLPADARILAPDKLGGYLIYHFAGARKVYFDGRSDFYGVEFMKWYIELIEVRPGWQGHVDRYGFSHALVPRRYSLGAALEAAGWRRLYAGEEALLLERGVPDRVR
ncbi:MAG: hypothetical protein FJW40_00815 [Acidobacteria bacterium]|nr:hypothetical protein [Acidobacteriota bacterium]